MARSSPFVSGSCPEKQEKRAMAQRRGRGKVRKGAVEESGPGSLYPLNSSVHLPSILSVVLARPTNPFRRPRLSGPRRSFSNLPHGSEVHPNHFLAAPELLDRGFPWSGSRTISTILPLHRTRRLLYPG